MTELFILAMVAGGQILAMALIFAVIQIIQRLSMAYRLRFDRGLSYTWRRAWRNAGFHLSH